MRDNENAPLNVGVIGCGQIAEKRHLPIWTKLKKVKVQAVSDIDLNRARKIAATFHVKNCYSNYREMLEKEKGIDIVDICTPTATHFEIIAEAARLGKHVVVEKPITHSSADCRKIIDIVRQNNVKLTVCHTQRFYPTLMRIKKQIDNQDLGKISRLDFVVPYVELQSWVSTQGGALWECATHQIYQTMYLLGDVKELKVTVYNKEEPQENMDIILFAERGTATLHLMRAEGMAGMVVYGDKGRITYPVFAFDSAVFERPVRTWIDMYKQLLKNNLKMITQQTKKGFSHFLDTANSSPCAILFSKFVDAVGGFGEVPVLPEEGLRVVEILEEIEQLIKNDHTYLMTENAVEISA
jgi:predicted dehydrogenase